MSDWTFHAQDVLTGAWITRNLQLRDVEIGDVLTGHGQLTAVVAPEDAALMSGGQRVLQEWKTAIYPEKHDGLRGGFILERSRFLDDSQEWHIICVSFSAYPNGEPYTALFKRWQVDALDCVREVWRFLQARPNGDIGMVIDQDNSGVLLGDEQPPPKPRRADVTYPLGSPYGPDGYPWPRPAKPAKPKRKRPKKRKRRRKESLRHWNAYLSRYADRLARWKQIKDDNYVARRPQWNAWHDRLEELQSRWEEDYGDREPYKLAWWEEPDCGEELERLAVETPFDWRERHTWTSGKAGVTHRLQLGYPTIGSRRTDKVFTPGVDLVFMPEVERGGDDYANGILALGAGEGRKTLRASSDVDQGRIQKVSVVAAKNVRRKKRLEKIAAHERKKLQLDHNAREVAVWDTDGNLTSYRLGDEIQLDLRDGWSQGQTWHKIVGRRYRPDDDDVIYWQLIPAERAN